MPFSVTCICYIILSSGSTLGWVSAVSKVYSVSLTDFTTSSVKFQTFFFGQWLIFIASSSRE